TRMQRKTFGQTKEGLIVYEFLLSNSKGISVKVISYGASVTELHVPDRDGKPGDVVPGFFTMEGYQTKHPYFGSTIGRVANRIAGGKFMLDGKEYKLATNTGFSSLHGGDKGFDKKVWQTPDPGKPVAGAT